MGLLQETAVGKKKSLVLNAFVMMCKIQNIIIFNCIGRLTDLNVQAVDISRPVCGAILMTSQAASRTLNTGSSLPNSWKRRNSTAFLLLMSLVSFRIGLLFAAAKR